MAFLTVNGWTQPVARDTAQRDAPVIVGPAPADSPNGKTRNGERGFKVPLSFTTKLITPAHADALQGLLRGDFYHFPFDEGLCSEAAHLQPTLGYTAALKSSGPTPKFGTRYLHVNSSGVYVYWAITRVTAWTLSWWHNHNNVTPGANAWTHYVVAYDPIANTYTGYTNGAVTYGPSSTAPAAAQNFGNYFQSLSSGTLTFGFLGKQVNGTNTAVSYFDDLVVSRFAWPAALVTAIYNGGAGRAFSPEPFVDVDGDALSGMGAMEMRAAVGQQTISKASLEGSMVQARRMSFTLTPRERR